MAPLQPRPGEVFLGKYRILRVVGEGGMGLVYAAHHLLLDTPVALKILSTEVAQDAEHVSRFLNEARLAARIKSANVCSVMDVGQVADGRPYLVMELLQGTDLASALSARGPLPMAEILDFALQALEGIAHAHSRGIVHRDLKPSNLFVAHEPGVPPVVKVLDFGISKFETFNRSHGAITSTSAILGSPAYMSPEQIKDARSVDERADLWSMGVILYELATGECPFDAPTPGAIFARILGDSVPTPLCQLRPDAPAALEAIVLRCIRRNPDERFPNVLELARAIAPLAPGSDAAISRILAVMSRPRVAPHTESLPSGPLPAVGPRAHPTNVSWTAGAGRSGTNKLALGAGIVALIVALGALALMVGLSYRAKKSVAISPSPPPAEVATDMVSVPITAPPPDPVSADPPPASAASAPPTIAPPHGAHRSPSHTGKPTKKDLLKDRR